MKIKMIFSLLLSAGVCLTACGDSNDTSYAQDEQTVTLSQSELNAPAEGGTLTVNVTSTSEFSAYATVDWLDVSPKASSKQTETLTVTVQENTATEAREGSVCVVSGGTRKYVSVTQAAAEVKEPTIEAPEGYTLVWNDEFDGNSLSGDWTFEIQNAGWVNKELQKYVKDADVTTVSNGTLKINLMKDGDDIKSARIYAMRNTGWKYGYFEARLKVPSGKGTWPAFWMMPVNFTAWPADGEIDIMEHVGFNPNVIHSTIHCNKYNNSGTSIEGARRTVPTATTDFHTYACEWTADKLVFSIDGEHLLTYVNDGTGKDAWPFDEPFYLILNLAWGGQWGGQQGVDESCLPESLEVDYVRVFQKK